MIINKCDNPLGVAILFISHAWEDNQISDYLYKVLSNNYRVFYDRAKLFNKDTVSTIGLLPKKEIAMSDVFLFIASKSSMNKKSRAFDELQVAEQLSPVCRPLILMVKAEHYAFPTNENYRLYIKFGWNRRAKSAEAISDEIYKMLCEHGGLSKYNIPEVNLIGGEKPDVILNILTSDFSRGIYSLNAPFPYYEMNKLSERINKLDKHDKEKAIDNLIKLYISEHKDHQKSVARQNAIILAAKISGSEKELISEFKKRAPDFPTPFLYRGFHVALGKMGDENIIKEYALDLVSSKGIEWNSQRSINKKFHLLYYGGYYPTLLKLRNSIKNLNPRYLLPLNVYTLGDISKYQKDIELLINKSEELSLINVPKEIIKHAIAEIRRKI